MTFNKGNISSYVNSVVVQLRDGYVGAAQADWEDNMRGKSKRTSSTTPPDAQNTETAIGICENCGKLTKGTHLDHAIYRFKCMNCGIQWHDKRVIK